MSFKMGITVADSILLSRSDHSKKLDNHLTGATSGVSDTYSLFFPLKTLF